MHLLFFHLEVQFGTDVKVVANNEVDLEQFLIEKGYNSIEFSDIKTGYGTCSLKDHFGNRETAKCYYVKKI